MKLPRARGPLSGFLIDQILLPPHEVPRAPAVAGDALEDDDLHLALYLCYELHYRGLEFVDEAWEWDPSLLRFRAALEAPFEEALLEQVGLEAVAPDEVEPALRSLATEGSGPSVSRYIETLATQQQFREFVVHRSAYHLKEADPHSWAIPRIAGAAKSALVEIQTDEYGSGLPERMHSHLFAQTMRAVGLDDRYGAYVGVIPGATLATVNLMSFFGLHRRWRGGIVGHLALFEMASTGPNRRYSRGTRRLGLPRAATEFYDEHVEADSVHEAIAARDLAGGLARAEPGLADDILFGARALALVDERWTGHVLGRWNRGATSLLAADGVSLAV